MAAKDCIEKVVKDSGADEKTVLKALDKAEIELAELRGNNYSIDMRALSEQNAAALMQMEKRKAFQKLRVIENKIKLKQNTKEILDKYKAGEGKIEDIIERQVRSVETDIQARYQDFNKILYNELDSEGILDTFAKQEDSDLVGKYVGQLTNKGPDGKPLIRSGGLDIKAIPEPERAAYKIAAAWAKMDDGIRVSFEKLGVPIGFLENRVGRNSFNPRKINVNPEAEAKFIQDSLETWDWDKMYLGGKTKLKYLEDFVTKVKSGIHGTQGGIDDIFNSTTDEISLPGGSLANSLGKSRTIQIKPEAWNQYMEKWGNGNIYDHMKNTMHRSARDITIVNKYGGSPTTAFDEMLKVLQKETPELGSMGEHVLDPKKNQDITNMLRVITGSHNSPKSYILARIVKTLRTSAGAVLLRNTVIRSLNDIASQSMRQASFYGSKAVGEQMSLFGQAFADNIKARSGQFGDELVGSWLKSERKAVNFFKSSVEDTMGMRDLVSSSVRSGNSTLEKTLDAVDSVSNRVFNKINPIGWWTDNGFDARMAQFGYQLGELSGKSFDELAPQTQQFYKELGVDKYWEAIRKRVYTDAEGDKIFMPDLLDDITDDELKGIFGEASTKTNRQLGNAREQAKIAIQGIFYNDANLSLSMPGLGLRAKLAKFQKGTWGGEFAYSFMQFKSYPFAFMSNIIQPLWKNGQTGILAAGLGTSAALTFVGDQLLDFVSGYTAKDYSTSKQGLINYGTLATKVIGLPWVDEIALNMFSEDGLQATDILRMAGPVPSALFTNAMAASKITQGLAKGDKEKVLSTSAKLIYEMPGFSALTHGHILGNSVNNLFNATVIEMFKPGTMKSIDESAQKRNQRYHSIVPQF